MCLVRWFLVLGGENARFHCPGTFSIIINLINKFKCKYLPRKKGGLESFLIAYQCVFPKWVFSRCLTQGFKRIFNCGVKTSDVTAKIE